MAILSADEVLWSEFEDELDALIEGTNAADKSYVEGRGMSLASVAVGSAATRLKKVRAATESRDLQKTKAAVDKAIPKIREAAFASSGDPENVGLEGNLTTLSALVEVLKQLETAAGGTGGTGNTGDNSTNSVAGADKRRDEDGAADEHLKTKQASDLKTKQASVQETRQEPSQEPKPDALQETSQETSQATKKETRHATERETSQGTRQEIRTKPSQEEDCARPPVVGGLDDDLDVVEPDDDPLSCLRDEEGDAGTGRGGRPAMHRLVAPVNPELAAKEGKLYWGKKAWARDARYAAGAKYALASRSLIGEGRQYIRSLNEALLLLIEGCTKKQLRPSNLAATEQEVAAAAAAAANLVVDEAVESREPKEAVAGTGRTQGVQGEQVPEKVPKKVTEKVPPPPSMEIVETLRMHVWQASKEALWPRLSLAYALEEQGESFEAAGRFSASCSVYSEASALFQSCAEIFPSQPEYLLRQWITARRALEAGSTGAKPDLKALRRCVKLCNRGAGGDAQGSADDPHATTTSCGSGQVCYEAHLELAGALLERGQFERCTEICRHVLALHDNDDDEALYSIAEALEALGRSQESMEYAQRAAPVLLDKE